MREREPYGVTGVGEKGMKSLECERRVWSHWSVREGHGVTLSEREGYGVTPEWQRGVWSHSRMGERGMKSLEWNKGVKSWRERMWSEEVPTSKFRRTYNFLIGANISNCKRFGQSNLVVYVALHF